MAAMTVTYGFSRALEISSRMRLLEARELMVVRVRAGLERRMSTCTNWVCCTKTAWDGGKALKSALRQPCAQVLPTSQGVFEEPLIFSSVKTAP